MERMETFCICLLMIMFQLLKGKTIPWNFIRKQGFVVVFRVSTPQRKNDPMELTCVVLTCVVLTCFNSSKEKRSHGTPTTTTIPIHLIPVSTPQRKNDPMELSGDCDDGHTLTSFNSSKEKRSHGTRIRIDYASKQHPVSTPQRKNDPMEQAKQQQKAASNEVSTPQIGLVVW